MTATTHTGTPHATIVLRTYSTAVAAIQAIGTASPLLSWPSFWLLLSILDVAVTTLLAPSMAALVVVLARGVFVLEMVLLPVCRPATENR